MTDKALEAALKACPWHGDSSDLTLEDNGIGCFWVVCGKKDCGCEGPYASSPEDAIAAWNRRAPLSALPGEAEVVAWMYEHDGMVHDADHPPIISLVRWDRCDEPWNERPLVTLASLQAMQARAEKAERERDLALEQRNLTLTEMAGKTSRAEAAEARVKELEDKYEPKERVFEFKGKTYRAVKSIEKGFYGQPINVIKVTALKGGSNG